MKKLNQWLTRTAVSFAIFSSATYAETPIENLLARIESQQINTQVITLPNSAPSSIQMMMNKSASTINIDLLKLFDLPDFKIELPGLENFYAVKEKIENNRLNGQNWIGDVVYLDPYGLETGIKGRAYFVEVNGQITGTIHTPNEIIQIFPDGAGGQVMVSSDPEEFENSGDAVMDDGSVMAAAAPVYGNRIDGESPASVENPYTIDIMFVVTPATQAAVNDVQGLIELSLVTGNDVLENSLIHARLQWVGTHYTDYEETDNMSTSLSALKNIDDGNMDEIHGIRESVGADMVMLVSDAHNYCGIAYVDTRLSSTFSVTSNTCMSSYTPIHELGHNFGAMHDRANGNNSRYSFGYGLQNTIYEPYWRSVMAYSCSGLSCPRIPYFSTPAVMYNDIPLGDPETYDNARVLRVRAAEIAGYFPHIVASCTATTATNDQHVSAGRAYTQTSGGFFPTTTYYAVGSDDSLGSYGFLSSTLLEQSPGFFTTDSNCTPLTETAFAPEVQNLNATITPGALRIDGEVFDANSDGIVSVELKPSGEADWISASIQDATFTVDIPVLNYGDINIDIRTTDSTGEQFTFTQIFSFELATPPVIQENSHRVNDQRASIYLRSTNSDNPVTAMFYQVDGSGIPGQGTWTPYPVINSYWTLEIDNIAIGSHTIYMYGIDSADQLSNVVNISVNILAAEAPVCVFAGAIPSTSAVAGEVDLYGFVDDNNYSSVLTEYRINSGAWTTLADHTEVNYRENWTFRLPEIYTDGSVLTIETRATDSTNLQSACGTVVHHVIYPTTDEAPTCQFTEIIKRQGALRYYMLTSDINGDQQRMYAKEASQSEWLQTWPHPLTAGEIPIPGFGDFIIQGRVVDGANLEGLCEQVFTIVDENFTPTIENAYHYYDDTLSTTILSINALDLDGAIDMASVQLREVGSSTWLTATHNERAYWHYDLGNYPNGNYQFEIQATDNSGHVSDLFTIEITLNQPAAPTVSNVAYVLNGRTANISGESFDSNGDLQNIWIKVNELDWFSMSASAQWSANVNDLVDGNNTIIVYASDTSGLESARHTLSIDVLPGVAPVIASIEINIDGLTAEFIINANDADGDLNQLSINLDGGMAQLYSDLNSGQWNISFPNLSVGFHEIQISVSDAVGNTSPIETRTFEISPPQSCFSSINSDHVAFGRATTRIIGQVCYGSFCFGGTTTYFANGSDNEMGTSASASTALVETAPGYFELGTCSVVDTTPPVITLNGSSTMNVTIGSTFVDPGATANDNVDGNISASIATTGSVDTSSTGVFTLTYNVSDSARNAATEVSRTINVVEGDACFESTLSDHLIANRAYEQYTLYYATGTASYLGSTITDANKVVILEETSPGNWSLATNCNAS